MKQFILVIAPIAIAAAGGALAVFGSYDDSPGGTLLGLLLILGAMGFGAKSALRTKG